ncbi:MAG: hypothetical protein QXR30_04000 [Candidatus Woesearchaeota archaeon]
MVKRIEVNQLPRYSHWPSILVGLEEFTKRHKDKKSIIREYGLEKWGSLYKKIQKIMLKNTSISQVDKIFLGEDNTIFSIKDKLYYSNIIYAHKIYKRTILKHIKRYSNYVNTIVELGAGYGSIIFYLAKELKNQSFNFIAGEFTKQGQDCLRLLSEKLYKGRVLTYGCDFTSPNIIEAKIPKNSLIFTSLSITCVPRLPKDFINNIHKLKPKYIINFEPIPQFFDNSLIGLLRKRYIEINDYNQTLYDLLGNAVKLDLIEIVEEEKNIFGENCFLPASLIVWKFKD